MEGALVIFITSFTHLFTPLNISPPSPHYPPLLSTMTQVTSSVSLIEEVTLRVVAPLLNNTNNAVTLKSPSGVGNSHWSVYIEYHSDSIVNLYLRWNPASNNGLPIYNSMHIFPHGEDRLVWHSLVNGDTLKAGFNIPCKTISTYNSIVCSYHLYRVLINTTFNF